MAEPFVKKTYYAMTLDPVHVGTGGYRLGRVDNTIVREPGTNIPKIPGSSISGAARAYTAMAVQSEDPSKEKYQKIIEIRKSDGTKEQKIYSCAGKGAEDGDGHCGRADCEVCVPFGFSKKGNSFQGLAQFYDARILFFPVHSMIGPVWVTSCSGLNDFQKSLERQSGVIFKCEPDLIIEDDTKVVTDLKVQNDKLNLGWLYLENSKKVKPVSSHNLKIESTIIDRIIVVSDKLFSQIVNDNLELRTSVAIDPATGAAESGALYTYEAIPRATVMWFDVVYNKPKFFRINGTQEISFSLPTPPKIYREPFGRSVSSPDDIGIMAFNVEKGLNYFESLGVGGMNTRGMGRLRVLNLSKVSPVTTEVNAGGAK